MATDSDHDSRRSDRLHRSVNTVLLLALFIRGMDPSMYQPFGVSGIGVVAIVLLALAWYLSKLVLRVMEQEGWFYGPEEDADAV